MTILGDPDMLKRLWQQEKTALPVVETSPTSHGTVSVTPVFMNQDKNILEWAGIMKVSEDQALIISHRIEKWGDYDEPALKTLGMIKSFAQAQKELAEMVEIFKDRAFIEVAAPPQCFVRDQNGIGHRPETNGDYRYVSIYSTQDGTFVRDSQNTIKLDAFIFLPQTRNVPGLNP